MVLKTLASASAGILCLMALTLNAGAQDGSRAPDEARKLVIEFRDGTRQTILLDQEWWRVLNILLPKTPAPLRGNFPAGRSPEPPPRPGPRPSPST